MGALYQTSGFPLVVSAYFVSAGILLFAALTAAVVGLHRGRISLYITFGAACLFSAGVTVAMAVYYLSDSVEGAVEALRWQTAAALLLIVAMPAFVALFTHAPHVRRWIAAVSIFAAVLMVANYALPYGIRYAGVESGSWSHMQWGESLYRLQGTPGPWNVAFRVGGAIVVVWAVIQLLFRRKKEHRREAGLLALCFGLVFLSSLHGALLDRGYVRGFHSVGFALVGLAFLMGVSLILRLREQNDEVQERAFRDVLTGLPNRAFAQERISEILAGPQAGFGGVLQCNLDHFKVLNDALSRKVGDELLREVARRLDAAARGKAIVARLGGDDYVAVLDARFMAEVGAAAAIRKLAEDMARSLAAPVSLGGQALTVFASIGITTFEIGNGDAASILGCADMALHEAKSRGRNAICAFVPELQERAEARYRIVEGLRRAVSGDELSLHFQPQVDEAGRVSGAEALLRWRSQVLGDVPPSTFIPAAEEAGLINAVGEWSLRRGCERLADWSRAGAPFGGHLSVNVSPWQLARPDFVAELRRILEATRIDAERLTLEITESAVLYDVAETVAKLNEIRTFGVRIALDDFGTGYSSLALIKDLPLDTLKIDQSFVRHLSTGANDYLVRAILAVGTELELDVIAEGVETEAERQHLSALGCRRFQGYLFCHPLPEPQFLSWVGAHRSRPLHDVVRL